MACRRRTWKLPFERVDSTVSGVPRSVRGDDTPQDPSQPMIRPDMHVYDRDGHSGGEIDAVDVGEANQQLSALKIKHGILFSRHGARVPTRMIATGTNWKKQCVERAAQGPPTARS